VCLNVVIDAWPRDKDRGRETIPDWDKISHVSFSARDKDQCAEWFTRVLGFQVFDEVAGAGWRGVLLLHADSETVIDFQLPDRNQGEESGLRPTPDRIDHIGFKIGSPEILKQWQEHLDALDIDYTPIADRGHGPVLAFGDPDGRQFEMFCRADHR
jgi:glyoxylase I family protein